MLNYEITKTENRLDKNRANFAKNCSNRFFLFSKKSNSNISQQDKNRLDKK